ncbi:MAG: maleylpyruvate isomerase family mycothiol-dependent enzyme [Acidimicrobiales bacterium]
MEKIVAALAAQQDELTALVAPLDDAGWARPSRCEGWTVCDVVLHLAQTNEMAIGSTQGRFDEVAAALAEGLPPATSVDEGAGLMVARERGRPPAEVRARWQEGANTLRHELSRIEPDRRVQWVAGELSARTLATTRLAETWIHTGDVAVALDHEVVADDRLWHIVRLAWRTLPYAFAQAGHEPAGPVAFALVAPNGDTWHFTPDDPPTTTIEGTALDLCNVAGQRADAADTGLRGEGPDAAAVLALVRTFA